MVTNNQRGSIQILVMLSIVALLGAAALSIDVGVAMAKRVQLSNGLDAAALAGGKELPANPTNAINIATAYLQENHIDPSQVDITVSPDNRQLTLTGTKPVPTTFARVLGINSTDVHANCSIKVAPVSSASGGIRPLSVVQQPLTYGQKVVLKEGAQGGKNGNFYAVSFGGDRGA